MIDPALGSVSVDFREWRVLANPDRPAPSLAGRSFEIFRKFWTWFWFGDSPALSWVAAAARFCIVALSFMLNLWRLVNQLPADSRRRAKSCANSVTDVITFTVIKKSLSFLGNPVLGAAFLNSPEHIRQRGL